MENINQETQQQQKQEPSPYKNKEQKVKKGGDSHLKVLLWKNWLLWKRNWCCSCCEILLPVFMCCFFFLFRATTDKTDLPQQSYLEPDLKERQFYPYTFHPEYPNGIDAAFYASLADDPTGGINVLPWIQECQSRKEKGGVNDKNWERNGHIAISPEGNEYAQKIAAILETHKTLNQEGQLSPYTVKYYDSLKDIQKYVTSEDYDEDICLGISFDEIESNSIKYSLVFNTTSPNPDNWDIPDTTFGISEKDYLVEDIDNHLKLWATSGFIQLQNWIDNIILKDLTGDPNAEIKFEATSMRTEKYTQDELTDILKGNMQTYYVLPVIITFLRMSYGLLIEKEKRIKEGMKIMGLSDSSFYLSWLIHYFIVYFIMALLITLVSTATIFSQSNFFLIFIWYLIFGISLLFQSLFITTFFTRAKVGNIVAMVFYLAMYMSSLAVGEGASAQQKTSISFFSQNAISFGADCLVLAESKEGGIGFSNADLQIENYSMATSLGMMILNILVFGILAFYFDQVFPNEFGKKQHPLFCFLCLCKNKNKRINNEQQYKEQFEKENQIGKRIENYEQIDQGLQHKLTHNEVLTIHGLSKIYPNGKKAVDNLSLDMFKDHITCLLGHNGAGKTTTISMLIGMQDITQGNAQAFGLDVQSDMSQLRHIMGFCPQHDILFDNLTCEEHLYIYAAFKGCPKDEVKSQVDQMLKDVDLEFKRDQLSKSLSGGQKRRLSVAIAFIGGSKLIYLDEPTSGMDTSARRFIWEMLEKYKKDRIVVLTTHFMDEADYLGDRIAIMGKGELICMGSSSYLKSKFGVGYNLRIVKHNADTPSEPIVKFIQDQIPQARFVSNISAEVQFQLRMEDISLFQALFDGLDQNKDQLQFESYGISITTMEEVFLKVAEEGQDALEENQSKLKESKLQEAQQIKDNEKFDNFDLNSVRVTAPFKLFMLHFMALCLKRIRYFKRDVKGFICEMLLPSIMIIFGLTIAAGDFVTNSEYTPLIFDDMYDETPVLTYGVLDSTDVDYAKSTFNTLKSDFDDLSVYETSSLEKWDKKMFENQDDVNFRGTFLVENIDEANNQLEYFLEIDTISRDAFPAYVNKVNEAFIKKASGNNDLSIQVTVAYFENTQGVENVEGVADGFVSAIIFSIALSFIPASMIAFTVKEREDQVKHQQTVSGVSVSAYWFSNLAIDLLKYYIPTCVFGIAMVFAFQVDTFTETGDATLATCLLFILYGWCIVPFSYCFGFLFKQYGSAQVASFFIHFIVGGILTFVFWILRIIESTKDVAVVLTWFFRFIPSFNFGNALISLGSRKLYALIEGKDEDEYGVWHIDVCLADVLLLAISGLIYILLIFYVEYLNSKGTLDRLAQGGANAIPYKPQPMDGDAEREMELIEKSDPKEYTVRVNKLRKVYKLPHNQYNQAVQQVSFGIKNGECFTLLGINGAGKTTTFKILSGDLQGTSGETHIQGFSTRDNMAEARKYIGYCPQFDALLENLTSQEHLELYAAIKGIPRDKVKDLIDQKILEMELSNFRNVCAGTYSGGNKRKLSVAIAMLGNPPICMLDEPSTGMDPKARRYMWNVISRISTKRKKSSILLTTHSMEEAEALSTKIAIMVLGQIKCIGSIQHIKNRFGGGYEVDIKIQLPTVEQVKNYITQAQINPEQVYNTANQNMLQDHLQKLGRPDIMGIIKNEGPGIFLYNQLISSGGLKVTALAEYILVDQKGNKIKDFIGNQFGNFSLIEHFLDYYRFKIETNIATGKIFGAFEQNKADLELSSYNVRQATIEQIFNMFAKDQIQTITKEVESQMNVAPAKQQSQ